MAQDLVAIVKYGDVLGHSVRNAIRLRHLHHQPSLFSVFFTISPQSPSRSRLSRFPPPAHVLARLAKCQMPNATIFSYTPSTFASCGPQTHQYPYPCTSDLDMSWTRSLIAFDRLLQDQDDAHSISFSLADGFPACRKNNDGHIKINFKMQQWSPTMI